ncbi:hypothetical protein F0U59_50110 [Archangium gephyra]|nr:hypothetical protein F0U59_50110 [Archangium gephyra]
MRFVLSLSVATVLGLSCVTVRPSFAQSCGPACAAPVAPSTGEILVPAATRAGQVVGKVVQAIEVIQGFLHVAKFLDEAQKKDAEDIIVECVKKAHFKVEEDLFGKGKTLPATDCKKPPSVEKKLAPTWAQHLGKLKHAMAFECIQQRLAEKFPNNFSIEPRYRREEFTNDLMLTDRWVGSKQPDVVLHFTRNATRIQCIYELKFPCGSEQSNPWSGEVQQQLALYKALGGECEPVIVTPQLEISRQP